VYLGVVKFKIKDYKYLGKLLIFTPIPLVPKKCGLSISFQWENKRVAYTYIHTISFLMKTLIKFRMFLSLYLTGYLIGLTFWVIPIEL